ncbi:MAG: SAF domain-containing protein [Jatrophihabitantaceae bacterium]
MLRLPAYLSQLAASLDGWPRRIAAAACLLGAVISAFGSGGARSGPLVPVLVASRALAAGTSLTNADLTVLRWPAANVPATAPSSLAQVIGRRVAADLARGQPIAPGSLLEPAVEAALATGRITTTVSLADPNQAAILRPGVHVDLYAEAADSVLVQGKTVSGSASVALNVVVIAILPAPTQMGAQPDSSRGLSLVIATDRNTVSRLAQHLSTPFLATLVPPP